MRYIFIISCLLLCPSPAQLDAQESETAAYKSFKFSGLPNLKYDADDGFGYGARIDLFNYAEGGYTPYYYLLDLQIFATTGGKREFWIFFDSPFILPNNQRITAELRYAKSNFAPYFGLGQSAAYDEDLQDTESPAFRSEDYYTFARTRSSLRFDYQRQWRNLRLLAGLSFNRTSAAFNDSPTLLAAHLAGKSIDGQFTNFLKTGLVYDSRDFEAAPTRGLWSEAIFERSDKWLGSASAFSRLTLAHRQYLPLARNVVLAQRFIYSNGWGDLPFYERQFISSSFRIEEAGGGAKSIRGVQKNRYLGRQWLLGNLELRYRFAGFQAKGQNFDLALAAFFDFGGAWEKGESPAISDLHAGRGAGFHLAWNKNFIVSIDAATGAEVGLGLYIGLGYLY